MAATKTRLFGFDRDMAEPAVGEVVGCYVVGIVDASLVGYEAIGMNILNGDVLDMQLFGTINIDQTDSFSTSEVTQMDTTERCDGVLARSRSIGPIAPHVGLEGKNSIESSSFATLDNDAIDLRTLTLVGLDRNEVIELTRCLAVVHVNKVGAMGDLLTNAEECPTAFGLASTNQDETSRTGTVPHLLDTTGFDGDSVTTLIEDTILDNEMARHFEIDAVVLSS